VNTLFVQAKQIVMALVRVMVLVVPLKNALVMLVGRTWTVATHLQLEKVSIY